MERLYSPREIAVLLGISPKTVYSQRWRAQWGLKGFKVGRLLRFRVSEINKCLESHQESLPVQR